MLGRWWALGAVSLATFMTYLDNNVVNVALPTIQRDLGLSIAGLEWIVSSYILVFAGLLLVGGRLADVFGARTAFFTGLIVFTGASVLAGFANGQELLIAARAVQGVGAALLTPASLALLPALFPNPRERGTAVGIWSAVGGLSLAIGPLTGGILSENAHWGWIFLINAPIGVITGVLGLLTLRRTPRAAGARAGLDLPGLTASAVALFGLTYALIEGGPRGWTSAPILTAFAVAAAGLAAFVVIETRSEQPMMDLSLFRRRVFSGGLLAMGLWAFGVFGVYFFAAIWLQTALGFTPIEAGAAFVPMALLLAVFATISPRVAERFGAAATVATGLGLMALSIAGLAMTGTTTTYVQMLPWFLVYGAGGGLLVPLTNVVLGAMPAERTGVASGMLNVSREVFGLLGITILGAILNATQQGPTVAAFLDAYRITLLVGAVIVLIGVPVSIFTLRSRKAENLPKPGVLEPVG